MSFNKKLELWALVIRLKLPQIIYPQYERGFRVRSKPMLDGMNR